jgi:hypothetical protein
MTHDLLAFFRLLLKVVREEPWMMDATKHKARTRLPPTTAAARFSLKVHFAEATDAHMQCEGKPLNGQQIASAVSRQALRLCRHTRIARPRKV